MHQKYVRPSVKTNKNDRRDAEAICETELLRWIHCSDDLQHIASSAIRERHRPAFQVPVHAADAQQTLSLESDGNHQTIK